MDEIIDYIMLRLYKQIFQQNKTLSTKETELSTKLQSLQWLEPSHFDLKIDTINKPLFDVAIKELQGLDRCLSPKTKLNCIFSCLKLISSTFAYFTKEDGLSTAATDDILTMFPYIVLKAKIERL
jgi:hypothetical protein